MSPAMQVSAAPVVHAKQCRDRGEVCQSLQHQWCLGKAGGAVLSFLRLCTVFPGAPLHSVAAAWGDTCGARDCTRDCWPAATWRLSPSPDLWAFLSLLPAPLPFLCSPPESWCLGVCGEVGLVRHLKTPHPTPDTSGMNLEPGECGMNSVSCGNGKLRQWLIDQIDSGKYPGLVWENDEKSIFRIPWKHAGKQDYNREEDAALFKVGLSLGSGLWGTSRAEGMPEGSAVAPCHPILATWFCWVPAAATA